LITQESYATSYVGLFSTTDTHKGLSAAPLHTTQS
jgi:hypothetical protein